MDFPFWLIPIIIVAAILPLMSSKQKPWSELALQEKQRDIIFIIISSVLLVLGVVVLLLY